MELTTFGPLASNNCQVISNLGKKIITDGMASRPRYHPVKRFSGKACNWGDSTLLTMYGLDVLAGIPIMPLINPIHWS